MRYNEDQTASKVLQSCLQAVDLIDHRRCSLDDFLDQKLQYFNLRRTVGDLLFKYFRYRKQLNAWILNNSSRPPTPKINSLLGLALCQCLFQNKIAKESAVNVAVDYCKQGEGIGAGNFINALLRKALREGIEFSTKAEDVFPDVLLRRWKRHIAEDELNNMAEYYLKEAAFTFRAVKDFVPNFDFECEAIGGFSNFNFYKTKFAGKIFQSEEFNEGKIYIQDPATSMSLSLFDNYNELKNILDLCGAPGGKALMLAEKISSETSLTINDISAERQKLTAENLKRFKLDFPLTVKDVEAIEDNFDLIFIDAPCSNTGVYRRRPDVLWRFSEKSLQSIRDKQKDILINAAKLVSPQGYLMYSTCSIEREENSMQIAYFLRNHSEFKLEKEQQITPTLDHDGAYCALLKRI